MAVDLSETCDKFVPRCLWNMHPRFERLHAAKTAFEKGERDEFAEDRLRFRRRFFLK